MDNLGEIIYIFLYLTFIVIFKKTITFEMCDNIGKSNSKITFN